MRPRRILHVVDEMARGGITTWLMAVLRKSAPEDMQMDFVVHLPGRGSYDDEASAMAARVIPCTSYRNSRLYARDFNRILTEFGPYDAVHSHCHFFSGFVLFLAKRQGVPARIAHSHSDTSAARSRPGIGRRVYWRVMRTFMNRYATLGLAPTARAAQDLFGTAWRWDPRWRIFPCGIDLEPFERSYDKTEVRSEFGIPDSYPVVGHVGRFTAPKNHTFILDVFSAAVAMESRLRLLLIGDGPLWEAVKREALRRGLQDSVIFAGSRQDTARLLSAGMDLFLFPSLSEGLGLALVEAQAAGIPCLASDAVPEEADVVRPLVRRLSLSLPATVWARELIEALRRPSPVTPEEALNMLAGSRFNILNTLEELLRLYSES